MLHFFLAIPHPVPLYLAAGSDPWHNLWNSSLSHAYSGVPRQFWGADQLTFAPGRYKHRLFGALSRFRLNRALTGKVSNQHCLLWLCFSLSHVSICNTRRSFKDLVAVPALGLSSFQSTFFALYTDSLCAWPSWLTCRCFPQCHGSLWGPFIFYVYFKAKLRCSLFDSCRQSWGRGLEAEAPLGWRPRI